MSGDLLVRLQTELAGAIERREFWARCHEALRTRKGVSVERVLLDCGVPALDADTMVRSYRGAANEVLRGYTGARNAARKLERRIAGLQRWQERNRPDDWDTEAEAAGHDEMGAPL